jgi:hypothetical protein
LSVAPFAVEENERIAERDVVRERMGKRGRRLADYWM